MSPALHSASAPPSPAGFLLSRMRGRWAVYALGLAAVALTNLTQLAIPKVLQHVIDAVSARDLGAAHHWALAILGVFGLQLLSRVAWRSTLARETSYAAPELKSALWDKVRLLPLGRFVRELSPGVVMNLATSDVNSARMLFGWTLVGVIDCIFMTAAGLVLMFGIDPLLTICTLAILGLLPFLMRKLTVQEFARHSRAQEVLALLHERCAQAASSLRLARLTGTERIWQHRSRAVAGDYRERRLAVAQTGFRFGVVDGIVQGAALAVLLAAGVWRCRQGAITLGEFVAMQGYLALMQMPLGEIGVILSEWQRGMASLRRLVDILGAPADAHFACSGMTPSARTGEPVFELREVRLQGREGNQLAQAPLTFSVHAGERIGIRGRVGSGKSVLLETMGGLRARSGGAILLHGADIDSLAPAELHRSVGLVSQHPFVFADTVRINVDLGRGLREEEIWHWLEVAGLAGEIRAFPGGLDTALGEWGINLSGGQRQRLTLARTLATRPEVLLLDDCLSAVDPLGEARIFAALARELTGTAVIWAGHRPSALAHCTRVLALGVS